MLLRGQGSAGTHQLALALSAKCTLGTFRHVHICSRAGVCKILVRAGCSPLGHFVCHIKLKSLRECISHKVKKVEGMYLT
jgi:hypothetical protein